MSRKGLSSDEILATLQQIPESDSDDSGDDNNLTDENEDFSYENISESNDTDNSLSEREGMQTVLHVNMQYAYSKAHILSY